MEPGCFHEESSNQAGSTDGSPSHDAPSFPSDPGGWPPGPAATVGCKKFPAHDNRRKSSAFFPINRRAVTAACFGSMARRIGVTVRVPPSCTSTLTSSPTDRFLDGRPFKRVIKKR